MRYLQSSIWELTHNPDFNSPEFEGIKNQAGLNSYKISIKEWVARTNAIGLTAKPKLSGGQKSHLRNKLFRN